MKEEIRGLILKAEDHILKRQFRDAGRCLEEAAKAEDDKAKIAGLFKRAAKAYSDDRETEDAARCYLRGSELLDKEEKAECLMDCWKLYLSAIAGYQYDCGFEWKGQMDGSHDSDHDFYQEKIKHYRNEAEKVLKEAASIVGVNRNKIISEAKREYERRKKDGWGASECLETITNVTKEVGH